jgi:hypothetical protein
MTFQQVTFLFTARFHFPDPGPCTNTTFLLHQYLALTLAIPHMSFGFPVAWNMFGAHTALAGAEVANDIATTNPTISAFTPSFFKLGEYFSETYCMVIFLFRNYLLITEALPSGASTTASSVISKY